MVTINKRLQDIILECQELREVDVLYPEGYEDMIEKYSREIVDNKLTSQSVDTNFARQLCVMNELEYDR